MRVLLMIGNNNMSLRELYSAVLDAHPTGWGTSFMSGMPGEAASIVSGYDAVIYELGAADGAERVTVVKALRAAGAVVITHVEGRQAAQRTADLASAGAILVANPVSGESIVKALDAASIKIGKPKSDRSRVGARERFRRFFGG